MIEEMKMDILEIEKLRQSYLKNTQKVVDTLVYEIRVRQNDMEVMIAERDRQIEELKKENANLNHKISKLCAELATVNKKLSQLSSKSGEGNSLEVVGEEDYQETLECCLQAYVSQQYRVVKHCIKEIIKYHSKYKEYMTIEHSTTLLIMSFLQNEDKNFFNAYKEYIDQTLMEYNIYTRLKEVKNGEGIQIEVYEEWINRFRRLELENVHSYVADELKEDIYDYITTRIKELKKSSKKQKQCTQQESIAAEAPHREEKAQKSSHYNIATLVELIADAFRKSDNKKLKKLFDYLLDNDQYYKNKLDHQSIQNLLYIGYFHGYDKLLINKYDEIKTFVTCHQSKLYQLLANERQTYGYKVVDQCLIEYMRREGASMAGLNRDNASYLKKKLKEGAMPCIDKLYEQMEYGVCLHSNKYYKRKRVWMKNTKMNQYIGFEATYCSKCNRYYISQLDIKNLNEYLAPYQMSTINDTPLNSKSEYRESNLNTTSVLKQMGYETTKSREERWRLLTQVIIPKLGKAKVTNHLKFLIRLHGSKAQMANAVFEWQYDLSRLQR